MSGSRRPTPAEQHLGDRLSALVDGELGHDSRERVLAHLATCTKCKAEADAQRRLKNVFAEAAPPPPSESFLARLQGLSGLSEGGDGGGSPFGGGGFGRRVPSAAGLPPAPDVFGARGESFAYVPAGPHATALTPSEGRALSGDPGFRVHPVGRQEAERSPWRGRRFAFAAAGAVSLAAIALGGVSTGVPVSGGAEARGPGGGSNVTPLRSPGAGGTTTPDAQRRRPAGPLLAQRLSGQSPAVSAAATAPLLPGGASPQPRDASEIRALTAPVLAGAAAMSPLIRPLTESTPLTPASPWSAAPVIKPPRLLLAPLPSPSGGASGSGLPPFAH
ncbi:zf-HC2 domain-containing protein [Streptomyces sp. NPDC052040]|uniref:anti-sigma factor family protein n=1 Tax=unclassified Streptomyces TaxID=2593676 RepID=UPI0037D435A2